MSSIWAAGSRPKWPQMRPEFGLSRPLHGPPLDLQQPVESGDLCAAFISFSAPPGPRNGSMRVVARGTRRTAAPPSPSRRRRCRTRRRGGSRAWPSRPWNREGREAVRRREGHQRRRQPLGDVAHLLGLAATDEQHVGAGLLHRLGAPERVVHAVDPDALVRPTITRLGSVRAATASLIRSAASAIGTRLSMPTWCSTRRGSSWSSISMHCDAGRLRHGDGAVDVDRVAPAAAGVQHHRDRADGADVHHHLDHLGERQAGLGDALVPAERAAARDRPP